MIDEVLRRNDVACGPRSGDEKNANQFPKSLQTTYLLSIVY
jgi:hypothetical protein